MNLFLMFFPTVLQANVMALEKREGISTEVLRFSPIVALTKLRNRAGFGCSFNTTRMVFVRLPFTSFVLNSLSRCVAQEKAWIWLIVAARMQPLKALRRFAQEVFFTCLARFRLHARQ